MTNKISDKIIQFRVFDKNRDYYGISEVTLPSIELMTESIKGTGIMGEIEIPSMCQTGSMKTTFNFKSVTPEASNLMKPEIHHLELKIAQQSLNKLKRQMGIDKLSVTFCLMPLKFETGKVEAGTPTETSIEFEVFYYKLIMDDKVKFEIDKLNGNYVIDGKDYGREIREALY